MDYTFKPRGVCSREIHIELDENHVVQKIEATGGCSGNLQGIASLAVGLPAEVLVERLKGIRCGFKKTSCPDQIAVHLEEFLQQEGSDKGNAE